MQASIRNIHNYSYIYLFLTLIDSLGAIMEQEFCVEISHHNKLLDFIYFSQLNIFSINEKCIKRGNGTKQKDQIPEIRGKKKYKKKL